MAVRGGSSRRRGAALAAVVVILLATTLLAHALLRVAQLEYESSRAAVRVLSARLAAQGAADVLTSRPVPPELLATVPGAVADSLAASPVDGPPGGSGVGVALRSAVRTRLSREVWLVEGRGRVDGIVRASLSRPVWQLDPATRLAELGAVVTVGAGGDLVGEERISAVAAPDPRYPRERVDCPVLERAVRERRSPPSAVWAAAPLTATSPLLGPLTLDSLARRMSRTVSGSGTPRPRAMGSACVAGDPWNWGNPHDPGHPCADLRAAVLVRDGTRIEGGVGHGIIILDGEAFVTDLVFYGVVMARGRLALGGATRIEGLVVALGGLEIGPGTAIGGAVCHSGAALALGELSAPSPIGGSGWIQGASR